jgi:hypothetical protein
MTAMTVSKKSDFVTSEINYSNKFFIKEKLKFFFENSKRKNVGMAKLEENWGNLSKSIENNLESVQNKL